MFRHKITYMDFNGQERKEDFYFHLSVPELTRLEAEIGKPLEEYIKELANDREVSKLLAFLEKVILNAYGRKSADGRTFVKNKEIRDEFEYSQAYAELFEEMLTNPELARKFGESISDNGKARKNQPSPKVVPEA